MKDNMLFQNKKTLKQCKKSVKMKKLLSIVLILGIVVTLTGCSLIPSKSWRTNVGGGTVITPQVNLSDKITSNGALTKRNRLVVFSKNNSTSTIDTISAAVVYYQGTIVVGYDKETAFDVKPGRSGNLNFFEPYDNDYDDAEYDNYKVFINEAYSYSY